MQVKGKFPQIRNTRKNLSAFSGFYRDVKTTPRYENRFP